MDKINYSVEDIEDEFEFVDNINESLWITPSGEMLTGDYDMGIRGTDHRALLDFYDLDRDNQSAWDSLHEAGFVRIVPETKIALVYENQIITDEQREEVESNNYVFENYGVLNFQNDNNLSDEEQLERLDSTFISLLKDEVTEDYYQGMIDITENKDSPVFNHEIRKQREITLENVYTVSKYLENKSNIKTSLDIKTNNLKTIDNKLSISFEEINNKPEQSINFFENKEMKNDKSIAIDI